MSNEPFSASFFVRGVPRPQPRHRAAGGGRKGVYNPTTANDWKGAIVRTGSKYRPAQPLEGPVMVDCWWFLPRPKRLMRKRDPDGPMWAPVARDRDNLDKAVLDALTADGWWRHDGQAVFGLLAKLYHSKVGVPGLRLRIVKLEPYVPAQLKESS